MLAFILNDVIVRTCASDLSLLAKSVPQYPELYKSHTAVISLLNNNDAILNISNLSIHIIVIGGDV
jgi:hypothetical protein